MSNLLLALFLHLGVLCLLTRNTQKTGLASQSKAFLSANPLLSKKLKAAVEEKLAAGDSHITAEAGGDVPSDSPSLAASADGAPDTTEEEEVVAAAQTGDAPEGSDAAASSSTEGGASAEKPGFESERGVLLEPGVPSVEALFETDVFSKVEGKAAKNG